MGGDNDNVFAPEASKYRDSKWLPTNRKTGDKEKRSSQTQPEEDETTRRTDVPTSPEFDGFQISQLQMENYPEVVIHEWGDNASDQLQVQTQATFLPSQVSNQREGPNPTSTIPSNTIPSSIIPSSTIRLVLQNGLSPKRFLHYLS